MQHQLIITFLGADKVGILGEIANLVCNLKCNILDSRQAHYGEDFSLTLILEGSLASITRAEFEIPQLSQKLELLCMVKRTKQHSKQHLVHLADVEFHGKDAVGIIKEVTQFFVDHNIQINAFRQKTEGQDEERSVACKMVVSMPQALPFDTIKPLFEAFVQKYDLQGSIVEKN
jgi:glycine cleavage system transcriptional repressor